VDVASPPLRPASSTVILPVLLAVICEHSTNREPHLQLLGVGKVPVVGRRVARLS